MPTARPFARNTGAAIAGTTQVGNLAVGTPTAGFAATGLPWWNGPDEDLGYVIATEVPSNNQPTPVPGSYTIGQSAEGGIIAYILQPGDVGYNPAVQKGLVTTPSDFSGIYGCGDFFSGYLPGTSYAIGSGLANTQLILSTCATRPIAASIATSYNGGGYTDWYLPSNDELKQLYLNRSLIGGFNTSFGSYYLSSTSSEDSGYEQYAIGQMFDVPQTYPKQYVPKNFDTPFRPVRSFTANFNSTASVGFWRSTAKTDASFIDLAQYVSRIAGSPQTFATASDAKTWLNTNGYWTSYVVVIQIGDMAYGGKVAYILQPGDPGYDANVQHGWVISPIIGTDTWTNANTAISTYSNNGFSGWFMPSYDDLRLTVNTNLSGYISDNGSGIWSSNNCLTVNPSCCCPTSQYSKWSFVFQSGYVSSNNVPQQYIARRNF